MHHFSPFSNIGTTFAFPHSDGKSPECKQFWKIILGGLHMEMLQMFYHSHNADHDLEKIIIPFF